MSRFAYIFAIIIGVPLLTALYYFVNFGNGLDKTFLLISTFLFSIFTGFFISRQASRFNKVRELVTAFDGKMSAIYRASAHISTDLQTAMSEVIKAHYQRILETGQWNIHFLQKSTTLSKLHTLLDELAPDEGMTKLGNQSLGAIVKGLTAAQDLRKQKIAMYAERIPLEQWTLIFFFAGMLVVTASSLSSTGNILESLLKAAFVASVLSVILILHRLNSLAFSEHIMGERSAHDVIDIIDGTK